MFTKIEKYKKLTLATTLWVVLGVIKWHQFIEQFPHEAVILGGIGIVVGILMIMMGLKLNPLD